MKGGGTPADEEREQRQNTVDRFRRTSNNKYGAVSGGGYASRKERRRAAALKAMERAGEITELREQVRYVLIPSQRGSDGRLLERECAYVADFVYRDREGNLVVEDAKGVRTREYIIKRKLMLRVHGVRIKET